MAMFAQVSGGVVTAIYANPQDVTLNSIHYPASIMTTWIAPDLQAIGIYPASYTDSPPTRFHTASGQSGVVSGANVNVTRTWVASTLAAAQAQALAILTANRVNKTFTSITFGANTFPCDQLSLILFFAAYTRAVANAGYTCLWKTTAGTFVTLTAAQIITGATTIMDAIQAQYTTEQTRVASINGAATVGAVETLLVGWGL